MGGDGLFGARNRHAMMVLAASAALAIPNARMAAALVEQERIRRELELAREIQRSLLRCLGKGVASPAELLARVNEEICETARRSKFVTVVAGVYDPTDASLTLANAGHQPPLLRRSDGRYQELPADSPPLGILLDIGFTEQRLRLAGGALYLCTDGATEARGGNGRQLGLAGLRRHIDQRVAEPRDQRLQSLVADIGSSHDDLTLVLVEQ